MVVFRQNGCIWAKVVVLGQTGCIWAKLVLLGKRVVYKIWEIVVFLQNGHVKTGCSWAKLAVFRQNSCFGLKWFYLGKNGCTWAHCIPLSDTLFCQFCS